MSEHRTPSGEAYINPRKASKLVDICGLWIRISRRSSRCLMDDKCASRASAMIQSSSDFLFLLNIDTKACNLISSALLLNASQASLANERSVSWISNRNPPDMHPRSPAFSTRHTTVTRREGGSRVHLFLPSSPNASSFLPLFVEAKSFV